ncbi:MAG: hypothetical protein ACTTKL_10120 [Treponema sp.]
MIRQRILYFEMRCFKSCYFNDLKLVNLFDNEVIEQVKYLDYGCESYLFQSIVLYWKTELTFPR